MTSAQTIPMPIRPVRCPSLEGGRDTESVWPRPSTGSGPSRSIRSLPSRVAAGQAREVVIAQHRLLLIATRGEGAVALAVGETLSRIEPGRISVVSRAGTVRITADAAVDLVLLHLDRAVFQNWVCARFGAPRKLRRAVAIFETESGLVELIWRLATAVPFDGSLDAVAESDLSQAIIAAFDAQCAGIDWWAPIAPLGRVTNFILANPGDDCRPEALAVRANMTLKTLQRQAKDNLGMTLTVFVRDVRLFAAHRKLASARESRPIAQIAASLGFGNAATFARAYRTRFGETPAETRRRSVENCD